MFIHIPNSEVNVELVDFVAIQHEVHAVYKKADGTFGTISINHIQEAGYGQFERVDVDPRIDNIDHGSGRADSETSISEAPVRQSEESIERSIPRDGASSEGRDERPESKWSDKIRGRRNR